MIGNAYNRDGVVSNISALVGKARAEGVPVVWVQHSDENVAKGSEAWQYVAELVRDDSETLVHKSFGDSFEGTDLEQRLGESHRRHGSADR